MGLIRYSQPVANSSTGTLNWDVVGSKPTAWGAVADPFRHYTLRTSGGGVDTDPVDDSTYLRSITGLDPSIATFVFAPICGDGDLASLTFHIRARMDASLTGQTTISAAVWRSGVLTIIGATASLPLANASFADLTVVSTFDPTTNAAWDPATMGSAPEFAIWESPLGVQKARVSRVYIEATFGVGPALGKDHREENWRHCDVCGFKHPYSRLQRPSAPHPQAGLVVCGRCYDQPDHDTLKIMSGSRPRDEQDTLY